MSEFWLYPVEGKAYAWEGYNAKQVDDEDEPLEGGIRVSSEDITRSKKIDAAQQTIREWVDRPDLSVSSESRTLAEWLIQTLEFLR